MHDDTFPADAAADLDEKAANDRAAAVAHQERALRRAGRVAKLLAVMTWSTPAANGATEPGEAA